MVTQDFSPIVIDDQLRRMEADYDLLKYEVDGWCAWPILRFSIQWVTYGLNSATYDWLQLAPIVIEDMGVILAPPQARHVVKTYTSGLAEQAGDAYKDIWFDDLLRAVGSYFKIETLNNPSFMPRRANAVIRSHCTSASFKLAAALLARTGTPPSIATLAQSLSACLRREFKFDVLTPAWIARRLRRFYWLKKIYARLLQQVQPHYVLTADPGEYELTAAAKELGIPVVEFQHGFLDRYHSGYSWTDYALHYKAHLPLADRLFLFGEFWRRELEIYGFWGNALRVVGSPRMDFYRQRGKKHNFDDTCMIVFTTQGIDQKKVILFLSDFMELAEGRLRVHLYIKLHPIYDNDKRPYLAAFQADARVEVLAGHEGPSTFELLAEAGLHISISSSCHYDALGLNVPTALLPLASSEVVSPLHKAGHAYLVRTPQELLDLALCWQTLQVPAEVSDYYFKSAAVENMKRELELMRGRDR